MLDGLGAIDFAISAYLNALYFRTPSLHALALELATSDLLKSGLLVALLYAYWHTPHAEHAERRSLVAAGVGAALAAAATSRALCHLLPDRARPNQSLGSFPHEWPIPFGLDSHGSFPSDHATLGIALAAVVFLLSRRAGVLAGAYVVLAVLLPRAYLGLHWASDLVAGSALGIGAVATVSRPRIREVVSLPVATLHDRSPALFHALMFLVGFGVMTRFDDVRSLATLLLGAQ